MFDGVLRFDDSRLLGEDYNAAPRRSREKWTRGVKGIVRVALESRLSEAQALRFLRDICLSMLRT
jgi:hypothetical protein